MIHVKHLIINYNKVQIMTKTHTLQIEINN